MSRPTRHVLITACILVVVSLVLIATRFAVLGNNMSGLFSGPQWHIAFHITAIAERPNAYVKLLVPPNALSQQIFSEESRQNGMTLHFLTEGRELNRMAQWRSTGTTGPKNMSFSLTAHMSHPELFSPAPSAKKRAKLIPYYLRSTDRIQASAPAIQQAAFRLSKGTQTDDQRVRNFFRFCTYRIANQFITGTQDALTCLTNGMSDCGGKSRLMAALCRASGIPARLVGGLILSEGLKRESHVWLEVLQGDHWVPYCPLNNHYQVLPENYLILYRGDYPLMRHQFVTDFTYSFDIRKKFAHESADPASTNSLRAFVCAASFYSLPPNSQWLVRILLLIPVGALIICLIRNMVGIPTLGTFAPVLIALAIHMAPLKWGIITLLIFVIIGYLVRRLIDNLKLLLVPRLSVMLSVVVVGVIVFVAVTSSFETPMGAYVGLLPVVILTMSIERCWLLELEDGFLTMIKYLAGTLAAVTVIYFCIQWRMLTKAVFVMPELLLVIIALILLVGRYSGFRLSELLRFRSIANEK